MCSTENGECESCESCEWTGEKLEMEMRQNWLSPTILVVGKIKKTKKKLYVPPSKVKETKNDQEPSKRRQMIKNTRTGRAIVLHGDPIRCTIFRIKPVKQGRPH